LKIERAILIGLLALAGGMALAGEAYKNFPGVPPDERTMRAQERVEELYESGDYARAMLIYKQDLAPKGDKYAQYMVGYMYLTGQSVPRSKARALAWYRLAGERGEPAILQARDALIQQMSEPEVAESSVIFAELWKDMGDNRILLDLIHDDMALLKQRTGTRLANSSTPLTIINAPGSVSDQFYKMAEERVRTRMSYLESNVEIIDIARDRDDGIIESLENGVRTELSALEVP
jgi:TPR repeat protein